MTWDALSISTAALAVCTFGLAVATVRLEWAWKKGFDKQLGLNSWFNFQARFDAKEMKRSRSKLAHQLENYSEATHSEVSEDVFDLFEDLGTIYKLKLINKDLAESSFSYYVNRWWRIADAYVQRERQRNEDDKTLFEDFEYLAEAWKHLDPKIDSEALKRFLGEEKNLGVE